MRDTISSSRSDFLPAGIIEGANDGRGRGRQVIAGILLPTSPETRHLQTTLYETVARTCNLIFIILDVLKPLGDKKIIETELEGFGIRLNKKPPAIAVRKKDKGGIAITNTVPLTNIDYDEIKAILSEYRIANADVAIRQPNATADDLVDVIEGNRVYIPVIYVSNVHICASFVISNRLHLGSEQGTHQVLFSWILISTDRSLISQIDAISIEELDLLYKIPHSVPISSKEWLNVDELIERMWQDLDLVRVYTKPRGAAPDYSAPVVLRQGKCSVQDFCNAIHKEIAKQMK